MTITYPISNPVSNPVVSPSGSSYLDSISGLNVEFELDATVSDSYGGSGQTWSNVIASPNSGAAQTAYDFWLGDDGSATATDPTFTGSAGDASAYFACDGGDYFTIKNIAGATTIQKAHRSDRAGTWMALGFKSATTPAGFVRMFGGEVAANGEGGISVRYDNAEQFDFLQTNGTTVSVVIDNAAAISGSTDYLVITSWDGTSSTNNAKMWVNATTATATASFAFNADTSDLTGSFLIGAGLNGGTPLQPLQNGSRIYHFSGGNKFIGDSEAAQIYSHLEARHNRDYTP